MNPVIAALPRPEPGSPPQQPRHELGSQLPRLGPRPRRAIDARDGAPAAEAGSRRPPPTGDLARLRAIVDATPALIALVDQGRVVRFANLSAERWSGRARASIVGRPMDELFDAQVHASIVEHWPEALAGQGAAFVLTTSEGAARRLQVSLVAEREPSTGTQPGVIVTAIELPAREAPGSGRYEDFLAATGARVQAEIETERRRIASSLHDQTGQDLTALRLHVGRILRRWSHDAALTGIALRMNTIIDSAGGSIRRIIANLRPLLLDDLGIVAAARALAQEIECSAGIAFDLSFGPGLETLSAEQNTAFYRVLQECLTNVVRHAGATEVRIALGRDGGDVCLRVSDNGRGFAPELPAGRSDSYGLFGIGERARRLGGSVAIDSAPGNGASVEFRLPSASRQTRDDGGASGVHPST